MITESPLVTDQTSPASAASHPAGDVGSLVARTFQKRGPREVRFRYFEYLPPDYGKDPGRRWPLVLFLHGAGERGTDLNKVLKYGPPRLVSEGRRYDFILIAPQCPPVYGWRIDDLEVLLEAVTASRAVDPDRLYLTGVSMGGIATWEWLIRRPQWFAAAAPVCGAGDEKLARRTRPTPVWAFHGALDGIIPLEASQEMVAAFKEAGGEARLTVYPDVAHESWERAYDDPTLYEWLLAHRRGSRRAGGPTMPP